jgi:hypothetical protein
MRADARDALAVATLPTGRLSSPFVEISRKITRDLIHESR